MSTIIVVEDDKFVREVLQTVLTAAGYDVLTFATADEAVRVAAAHRSEISLLITNHRLRDGCRGRDVAEQIRAIQPDLPILQTSGYREEELRAEGSLAPNAHFLGKPFQPRELLGKIRSILAT